MIGKDEVDTALSAASGAIEQEFGLAWVRNSSLFERAYYLGLYWGLKGIAKEEDASGVLLKAILETGWARSGDDTFGSTQTGKAFERLQQQLTGNKGDQPRLQNAIQDFEREIDRRDHDWNSRFRHVRELLKDPREWTIDTKRPEAHYSVERLEPLARYFALLETDHRRWKHVEA